MFATSVLPILSISLTLRHDILAQSSSVVRLGFAPHRIPLLHQLVVVVAANRLLAKIGTGPLLLGELTRYKTLGIY